MSISIHAVDTGRVLSNGKAEKTLEAQIGMYFDGYLASTSLRLQRAIYSYGKRVTQRYEKSVPIGPGRRWTKDGYRSKPHLNRSMRMRDQSMEIAHVDGSIALYRGVVLYFASPNYRIAHLFEKGYYDAKRDLAVAGRYPLKKALEAEFPQFKSDLIRAEQRQEEILNGRV